MKSWFKLSRFMVEGAGVEPCAVGVRVGFRVQSLGVVVTRVQGLEISYGRVFRINTQAQ